VKEIFDLDYKQNESIGLVKVANGKVMKVLGKINFYMKIGDETFAIHARVVSTLSEAIILGLDFFSHSKNRGVINLAEKFVELRENRYPFAKPFDNIIDPEKIDSNENNVQKFSPDQNDHPKINSIDIIRLADKSTILQLSQKVVPATVFIENSISDAILSSQCVVTRT